MRRGNHLLMGGKYHKFRVHSHGMSGHGFKPGPVRRPPFGVNGMRLGEALDYAWPGLDSRAEVQLEENGAAAAGVIYRKLEGT